MADYYTPTVIQPSIPIADMTPLEHLILTYILEWEQDGDTLYFYSETGPSEYFSIALPELRKGTAKSAGTASFLADYLAPKLVEASIEETDLDLDLTDTSWEFILQDIVKRSRTLDHISVISSYTCSRMRPDGFGGCVTVVTADSVFSNSTHEMEAQLLNRAEYGDLGVAPGHGIHVIARVSEADVRVTVGEITANDPDFAGMTDADVTDADIRAACAQVIAERHFAEEQGAVIFAAALRALRDAQGRTASHAT